MPRDLTFFCLLVILIQLAFAYNIGGGVGPNNNNNGGGGGGVAGAYCNTNADCQYGLQCTPSVNGVKICLQGGGGGGVGGCNGNYQCPRGQSCVMYNGQTRCQINAGGYVPGSGTGLGVLYSSCLRDADCEDDLQCTRYFGVLKCMYRETERKLPESFVKCEEDMDCPSSKPICDWSTFYKEKICYAYIGMTTFKPHPRLVTNPNDINGGYIIPIDKQVAVGGYITTASPFQLSTNGQVVGGYSTTVQTPTTTTYQIGKGVEPKKPQRLIGIGEGAGKKSEESIAEFSSDNFDNQFYRPYEKEKKPEITDSSNSYKAYPELLPNVDYIREVNSTMKIDTAASRPVDENKSEMQYVKMEQLTPTVVKPNLIDPAALPCEFDYQCRMGESCSGLVQMVDRNVTVCRYDSDKKDRQCIWHSDCLKGQRCQPTEKPGTATCQASIEAALGTVQCFYDFECSGGEKCRAAGKDSKIRVVTNHVERMPTAHICSRSEKDLSKRRRRSVFLGPFFNSELYRAIIASAPPAVSMFPRLSVSILASIFALILVSDALLSRQSPDEQQHQITEDELLIRPSEVKRFYSWEDAKRSAYDSNDFKDMGIKRKQFYAWAGKRSIGDSNELQKRKQFYAWAGRK